MNDPSASLSLLTSLVDDVPFFIDYRLASNTQWDFAEFVYLACKAGYLKDGDYLVIDNAAVHCGADSFDILKDILTCFGVKIIKLPTYSPELNPCELVFSQMKRFLRYTRLRENSATLCDDVLRSLRNVEKKNLYNYYVKCVCPRVILPEFFVEQSH